MSDDRRKHASRHEQVWTRAEHVPCVKFDCKLAISFKNFDPAIS